MYNKPEWTPKAEKEAESPGINNTEKYTEDAGMNRVAFIGSECYPFVKTGGLGDVMYALPRALVREGTEVRVIMPLYGCMPQK